VAGLRALRDGEAGALRIAAFAPAADLLAPALAEVPRAHPDAAPGVAIRPLTGAPLNRRPRPGCAPATRAR
jgi:hypothetical protein